MTEYNINSQWTLIERAKRSVDGKTILPILDVMDKRGVTDFLMDVPYFPANMGLQHRIVRTVSRPASTRRNFYQGVGSTITTTQVINEPVVLFEQRSQIDEDVLDTVENPQEARRQEDEGHIARLLEDFVNAIFNDAKSTGSEYIDGLKTRLGTLSYPGHTTSSLPYCYTGGGSATLTSAYVVEWGPRACHAIYPSGSAAQGGQFGISARDKGKEKVADSDTAANSYYCYVSQFKKWVGLACWDDRKVVRYANLEPTGSTTIFDEDVLIQILNHGRFNVGATRIYVNPYTKSQIDILAKDKYSGWALADVFGKPTPAFWGVPIRVLDDTILTITESAVT